ncbi:MAG: DUF192 domain-containing protein [Candidatus Rokuibacteriota bacterium]
MRARRAILVALVALAALAPPASRGLAQDAACARWREAFAGMPSQMITVEAGSKRIGVRVRVAETGEQQAAGFQCATVKEIDGNLILFDFGREIHTQFHMRNVPAALDIAFAKADGRIFSILVMEPSPTALSGPLGDFRYALEARKGFYASQGIRQGEARLVIPAR